MDLQLSEDQELFRETTRRFLESTCPVPTVREWAEKEPAGFPADWWRRGAELGWTSLLVSEVDGGGSVSGHGLLDLILVAEEMGRLVTPGPLLPVNIVAAAITAAGSAEQRGSVLPGLLAGDTVATWCLEEPGGSFSTDRVGLEATPDGDGYVLQGEKGPAQAAAEAEWLLVTARGPEGLISFLVPAETPGVTVVPAQSLDLVRRFAVVRFDQVRVGAEHTLEVDVEGLVQLAVVLQCAEMVGAVDAMFQRTVEYSFDRFSFGRPLASYQALKHRFADMKLWLEACHATALGAARSVDAREERAGELISVAKSYIGDRGPAILQDCVQMHGGIGVTWDHDLHLYIRRVVQDRSLFGSPSEHRERLASFAGI